MIDILGKIIEDGLTKIENIPLNNLVIDNIILGKSLYTMKSVDNIFSDMNMCLVLTEKGYGFSYFQENINFDSLKSFVNKDLKEAIGSDVDQYFKVALADCLFSIIQTKSKNKFFVGTLRQKATQRAKEIVKNIPIGSRVALLGAASEIVEELVAKKCRLKIIDFEDSKIGLSLYGYTIEDGRDMLNESLLDCEYIIATGMIFITNTANSIFQITNENKKKLIIYMQTGSNFGGNLVAYGAEKVVCEYFPFYDFNGPTRYSTYEKSRSLGRFLPHF